MLVSKDRWQKREAFAALMEKGDYQGYITTEDIMTVFPEVEESDERLERLEGLFRSAGVEVFADPAQIPPHLLPQTEAEQPEAFDLSVISTDDTVGLYLKEMARVPLLTTEQEVDLAKRIERGKQAEAELAGATAAPRPSEPPGCRPLSRTPAAHATT
jgi:RNA polymerase primary sigma factor